MFRIITADPKKELRELSLKQRQQFMGYAYDSYQREFPTLHEALRIVPPRVISSPKQQHDEEPGSPSKQLRRKL